MRAAYLCLPLALLACSREKEHEPRKEARPSAAMTGEMPKLMRNCPSAVPSATTTAMPTATGVNLTITSKNPEAQRKINALSQMHASFPAPLWGMPEHTGMHTGPGTVGQCPIIHAGTTITYEAMPEGALLKVAARSASEVRRLQV